MLGLFKTLFLGMTGAMTFRVSPLYRYPYRNSAEGLRGDWLKLGRDIENALEKEAE